MFLFQVGRMFPQAVYFPIRTLYLTLKIEQRERYKSAEQAAAIAGKLAASSQKHSVSKQSDKPNRFFVELLVQ
jgi:transformation/transcription domain-associated protein